MENNSKNGAYFLKNYQNKMNIFKWNNANNRYSRIEASKIAQ